MCKRLQFRRFPRQLVWIINTLFQLVSSGIKIFFISQVMNYLLPVHTISVRHASCYAFKRGLPGFPGRPGLQGAGKRDIVAFKQGLGHPVSLLRRKNSFTLHPLATAFLYLSTPSYPASGGVFFPLLVTGQR